MTGPWWTDAVVYHAYLPVLAGGGGLAGLRDRLDHVASLGVDALLLSPFHPGGGADGGYDVVDHRAVDPALGTLADLDALVGDAHRHGLRVVLDVVANHVSTRHPWFVRATEGDEDARARFHVVRGSTAPNGWRSILGGPAWSPLPDPRGATAPGETAWYLHLFDPGQADLDWEHPAVAEDVEKTLRFWLDRGADGLRFDAAGALSKAPGYPEVPAGARSPATPHPFSDRPAVHDVYRRWASVLAGYSPPRLGVAEVWGPPWVGEPYLRPDELGQAFAMDVLFTPLEAAALRRTLTGYLEAAHRQGREPAWVHGSHDVDRAAARWPGASTSVLLLLLCLPGSVYLYAGDELALPQSDVPAAVDHGRGGARTPLPWAEVATQTADPASPLSTVRAALAVRRDLFRGGSGSTVWAPAPDGVLRVERGRGVAVLNASPHEVAVARVGQDRVGGDRADVVVTTSPDPRVLRPGDAAWLRRRQDA